MPALKVQLKWFCDNLNSKHRFCRTSILTNVPKLLQSCRLLCVLESGFSDFLNVWRIINPLIPACSDDSKNKFSERRLDLQNFLRNFSFQENLFLLSTEIKSWKLKMILRKKLRKAGKTFCYAFTPKENNFSAPLNISRQDFFFQP